MTPVTTFAGRTVAVFGLGALGARDLPGAAGRRRAVSLPPTTRRGAGRRRRRRASRLRTCARPTGAASPRSCWRPACRSPIPSRTGRSPRPGRRASRSSATSSCSAASGPASCPEAPFVAITGTNGKSTTTALIAHILRSAGRDAQMGGNIGTAILELEPPARDRVHVIEMSSFQIELTPSLAPSIGVLLNVSPDHLDRHGTMEHYAALKARLVGSARPRRRSARTTTGAATLPSGCGSTERGWVDLVSARDARGPRLVRRGQRARRARALDRSARRLRRPCRHRLAARPPQHAERAGRQCRGTDPRRLAAARWPPRSRTFPGLPHRLEEIGRVGRTLFINDSKATNADSAATALAAFERDIFWILGGKPKEGGITSSAAVFPAHRQGLSDR